MTTTDNTPDEPRDEGSLPTDRRPLGMWLRLVDRLITREFAAAFDGESVSRREWMVLNAVAGTVETDGVTERLAQSKHVARLADRGWIAREHDGAWALTDAGTAAFERLREKVDAVRTTVAGSLSDDEFTQLKTSLEKIARGLGWDETQPLPPRRDGAKRRERGAGWGPYGHGHGFGGYGHEFGERSPHGVHEHPRREFAHHECEHGLGPGHRGFGPEHHAHLHEKLEHGHHGRHGRGKRAERAYERGFAAGFDAAKPRATASTPTTD